MSKLKEEIIYGDFLIAYFDKNTDEYKRYETVRHYDKEKLLGLLNSFNTNKTNSEYGKIYEDKIILQIVEDCHNSYSNKCLIEDMKDKINMLSDTLSNIEYRIEELEEMYGGNEE